ncbi:MAG: ABC transporter permease [Thiobacillus sp.]|nr:ABC transporter permease [Thiobacillus sp.]
MSIHYPATPSAMLGSLLRHRELLWDLVKRDFIGRYKGSMLGVVWSLFNPLFMLAIYTIVFSVAFKARWGAGEESKVAFAIVLFSGMIVHSFFAECLNRAPGLITSHANYVKKVVFPLEILTWMALLSALLHFLVSFGVLLVFCLLAGVAVHIGALLIPIVLIPLILMMLGLSWIFASLGVYLRDLSQAMGMVTTVALFLAPVFYPIESLPETYQALLAWNPITLPIIQLRDLMLWDKPLQWGEWAISLAIGASVCSIGYWWFQKSRRGFADVL